MASLFVAGTVFLDHKAQNIAGSKPKFFIGLNDADDDDDVVISCVFNTEHRVSAYKPGCNRDKQRFFLPNQQFKFQTDPSTIMLHPAQYYQLSDILNGSSCDIIEQCNDLLFKQIKNCLDKANIPARYQSLVR